MLQYRDKNKFRLDPECYGSTAGLLLLDLGRTVDDEPWAFVVYNPLTRMALELPVFSSHIEIFNAGIVSDRRDLYKVVVVGTLNPTLNVRDCIITSHGELQDTCQNM